MRPWVLAETNYTHTKNHRYEVAVLPFGAVEPHNLHLPYCTDLFEANIVSEKICEAAYARARMWYCCRPFRTALRRTCARCHWR